MSTPSPRTPERRRLLEPPVSETAQPFWDATRERRMLLQWCTACEQPVWYPRDFCPACRAGADALEWRPAVGTGTVYACTVEQRPTLPGVFGEERFVVALVALDEGPRFMANVVGCPPDAVHVGMPVRVTWEALSDGRHLPLFEPVGG